MSFICSTDRPLVIGSAIINSVFTCLINTSCLLILSLTRRYLMSICLLLLPFLLFLEKNMAVQLSQKILIGLSIELTILKPPTTTTLYGQLVAKQPPFSNPTDSPLSSSPFTTTQPASSIHLSTFSLGQILPHC